MPDWQWLVKCRKGYPADAVPLNSLLLVDATDIQKDRIEASIWAFGRGKEPWLTEHRALVDNTTRDVVWKTLAMMLTENWTHVSGVAMPLTHFALDTGLATQEAYTFMRACHDPHVMVVKGVPCGAALIDTPTAIDASQGDKRLRQSIKVLTAVIGIARLEPYSDLRKSVDVGGGGSTPVFPTKFVHLPGTDAEFIQQLCAEQLITCRDRNGFPVYGR